jgi:hypothetical protein
MKDFDKKYFLWGALFGMVSPFIGLFVGLQILPILGTVLMFPIILISKLIDKPFGEFSTMLIVLSVLLSIIVWGGVFVLVGRLKAFIS